MRISIRAGITAIALTGGTLVGVPATAHAADAAVLYVRAAAPDTCTDSGPGTAEQPFCTIGAAAAVVSAGQTVDVGAGDYPERVTIDRSGTPEQPITFRGPAVGGATLTGPRGGFVIEGQHDVKVVGLRVNGSVDLPAVDVRDSSAITIGPGLFVVFERSTAPAIRLSGVTDSVLTTTNVGRVPADGIVMDAATRGVVVKGGFVRWTVPAGSVAESVGIRVAGSGNSILNLGVHGFGGAAIAIEPGARDNIVANNQITSGPGVGIHNRGATGTAIVNNDVDNRCRDGIRIDGSSTSVSVQNNVLEANGDAPWSSCPDGAGDGAEIGIYDGALGETVVDYNNAFHEFGTSPRLYAWDGAAMSLAAFRAASGQAAHDLETDVVARKVDSANSAAPGFQETDRLGYARVDLPGVTNTGAGPITYADRGVSEGGGGPQIVTRITLDPRWNTVRVDASTSLPGSAPITSYAIDFGDGTPSGPSMVPSASHRYDNPGDYAVTTTLTGADNRKSVRTDVVSVLPPPTGETFGLLSLFNLRYVTQGTDGVGWTPTFPETDPGTFLDLVDAGSGKVALHSVAIGRYFSVAPGTSVISPTSAQVGPAERFTLTRNADGSITLQSEQNGRYVSIQSQTSPVLVATRTAVSTWEKWYPVKVSDSKHTLKAAANGKFVSAESAGTKPLIASRPLAQAWEQFDIVDLSDGQVALLARANNHFVAAESGGTQPLQAKRVAVSTWERFTMVRNSDGTVSFRSATNNLYVSAEGAGTKPLVASRPAINTWEKFTLLGPGGSA